MSGTFQRMFRGIEKDGVVRNFRIVASYGVSVFSVGASYGVSVSGFEKRSVVVRFYY